MKQWQESLRNFIDERSEVGHVVIAGLAEEFCSSHRDELIADADAHMLRRVAAEAKNYMHAGAFTSQGQTFFEGMDLPAFIAVRKTGAEEIYYVRTGNATWADLEAGRQERVNNVTAAQTKLEAYDESLYRLRPIMENNPTMTTNEALITLAQYNLV